MVSLEPCIVSSFLSHLSSGGATSPFAFKRCSHRKAKFSACIRAPRDTLAAFSTLLGWKRLSSIVGWRQFNFSKHAGGIRPVLSKDERGLHCGDGGACWREVGWAEGGSYIKRHSPHSLIWKLTIALCSIPSLWGRTTGNSALLCLKLFPLTAGNFQLSKDSPRQRPAMTLKTTLYLSLNTYVQETGLSSLCLRGNLLF
jgi:hypothetical protein